MQKILLLTLTILFIQCNNAPVQEQEEPPLPPEEIVEEVDEIPEDILDAFPEIEGSSQLLMALNTHAAATATSMLCFQKIEGLWKAMDTIAVNLGKAGIAAPGEKREGDGKTPSGLYLLGPGFGYAPFETAIEYITLDERHHWISDSDSSNYNQLVTYAPVTKEMEVMRRQDHLYELGLVVQYNTEPVVPGHGSAIFLHVERAPGKPTLGCISMAREEMLGLLEWLDPNAYPVILLGTEGT